MSRAEVDVELSLHTSRRRGRAPSASVLYDAPGPRARRTIWIGSALAAAVVLFLGWRFVYRPLEATGQFSLDLWGPFVDSSNNHCPGAVPHCFDQIWPRLGQGLLATLRAAGLAILASLVFGLALAGLRIQLKHLMTRRYRHLPAPLAWSARGLTVGLNGLTRVCVEVLRGMPVVITIFFVARGLPELGLPPQATMWYLVIGLTLYNAIVIAEVVRSGMEGLPKGQREAASSLGLSSTQTITLVLLPQAVRIMLPAIISQLVVVLKDTSLGFIISYNELLNIGKLAIQLLHNPLQMYFVIGLTYLAFNYALSRLADWTQRRLARGGV
ncbi:MAG TPA: amino acid ABC transporter permease [Micromonosporaceae bacterium]|jgi:glutamate transport system permease protein